MKITIKYFSWIRVKLKKGSEEFDFEQNTTFKIASNILREKHPIFEEVFNDSSIKFFLNLNQIIKIFKKKRIEKKWFINLLLRT